VARRDIRNLLAIWEYIAADNETAADRLPSNLAPAHVLRAMVEKKVGRRSLCSLVPPY
jgi:hypothetical protein